MFIEGRRRRPALNYSSFTDLTDIAIAPGGLSRADRIEFVSDLEPEVATAVWARWESTDDTDQTARAILRADRDALEPDDPKRRLYNYMLGDVS